ncbi:BatD family protein [Xanthobacter sp. 126]|uniref:BatD family protein n=1 Tax=Xanthobacter sp. 126 TaxID=1131814 RepID=UPI00045EB6BA|nr:BatD family protein [Xanthobacter sp. 126]
MRLRRALCLLLLLCPPAGAARAESLRLVIPEMRPVAGEMIPIVVRGEYERQITLEKLSFPGSPDYDWMQLARDQWRTEQVEGRSVRVFERRIALFPRHAGPLTIGPVTHRLTVVGTDAPREELPVTAEPVTVGVAPFPVEGATLAARSLSVTDVLSAEPGKLRDGETLVRRVTIEAVGAPSHLVPPRPIVRAPWLISFAAPEARTQRLTPDGPVTTVTWEWHLRPSTGDPAVLPAIAIPWFDTEARQMRTAEIPAIPFGYASIYAGVGGTGHLPAGQVRVVVLAVTGGLMAGCVLVLAGLGPRRRDDALRALGRLSPVDPTRIAVRRAVRTGEPFALRRAVERHLRRWRALGLPVSGQETASLDARLYGRGGDSVPFDAEAEAKAILRAVDGLRRRSGR